MTEARLREQSLRGGEWERARTKAIRRARWQGFWLGMSLTCWIIGIIGLLIE